MISDAVHKYFKKAGFLFVSNGSIICYAFMQAVGMVNDHTQSCFMHRHAKVKHLQQVIQSVADLPRVQHIQLKMEEPEELEEPD